MNGILPLTRPIHGLDLETTGTNFATSRIVELALETHEAGKAPRPYRTLVNPGVPIPPGATRVHKLTDEDVAKAPRFEQLIPSLLKGLKDCDFAGYNVRFDLKILQAEFKRYGVAWDYEDARIIDGFRLWQIVDPRSLEDGVKRWLTDAAIVFPPREAVDLGDGKAHNALWDVKASMRIIEAQVRECEKLPRDVQKLHDLCWPGWFDAEGKLQWRDGELCITFGEHRDKPLRQVPRSYLDWIGKKDFSEKVKATCRDAVKGVYPKLAEFCRACGASIPPREGEGQCEVCM